MGMISDLIVRLGWDGTAYKKGLNQAEHEAQKSASRITANLDKFVAANRSRVMGGFVGAFGVGGIFSGFKNAAENAARISRESGRLGVSVTAFQEIEHASRETGMSVEEIVKNMRNLPEHVRDSISEFRRLGLGISETNVNTLTRAQRNIDYAKDTVTAALGPIAGALAKTVNTWWAALSAGWNLRPNAHGWHGSRAGQATGVDQLADLIGMFNGNADLEEENRRKQIELWTKRSLRAAQAQAPAEARKAKEADYSRAYQSLVLNADRGGYASSGDVYANRSGIAGILERQTKLLEQLVNIQREAIKDGTFGGPMPF